MARPEAEISKVPSAQSESTPNWDHGVLSGISNGIKATKEAIENHPYLDVAAAGAIAVGLATIKGGKAFTEIGNVFRKTAKAGEEVLPELTVTKALPQITLGGPIPAEARTAISKMGIKVHVVEMPPGQVPTSAALEDNILWHESAHPLKPGDVSGTMVSNPGGIDDFKRGIDWGGPTSWTDADHKAVSEIFQNIKGADGKVQIIGLGGTFTADDTAAYLAKVDGPQEISTVGGVVPRLTETDGVVDLSSHPNKLTWPAEIARLSKLDGAAPKPLD